MTALLQFGYMATNERFSCFFTKNKNGNLIPYCFLTITSVLTNSLFSNKSSGGKCCRICKQGDYMELYVQMTGILQDRFL